MDADMEELETVVPYEGTDEEVVAQCEAEVKRGYTPELKPLAHDPKDYDRIILGTPTWWYTMASPVLTFIKSVDWTGKTVIPFQTSCGWPGKGLRDMKAACAGACFGPEMHIQFSTKQFGLLVTPERKVTQWIEEISNS